MRKSMIYLEESQHRTLSQLAAREGQSFAALCREAIEFYLTKVKKLRGKKSHLQSLAGLGRSSQKNDDARQHDRILYEDQE